MQPITHITEGVLISTPEGPARLVRGQTAMIYAGNGVTRDAAIWRKAVAMLAAPPRNPHHQPHAWHWVGVVGEEDMCAADELRDGMELSAPSFAATTRIGRDFPTFGAYERATWSNKQTATWRALQAKEVIAHPGPGLQATTQPPGIYVPALGYMDTGIDNYDIITKAFGHFIPAVPLTAGMAGAMDVTDARIIHEAVMRMVADGRQIHLGWMVVDGTSSAVRLSEFTPRRVVGKDEEWKVFAREKTNELIDRLVVDLDQPRLKQAAGSVPEGWDMRQEHNSWSPEIQAWHQTADGAEACNLYFEAEVALHFGIAERLSQVVWEFPDEAEQLVECDRRIRERVFSILEGAGV